MASEKSIPIATMLAALLLTMMYSTDAAIASNGLCEDACRGVCQIVKKFSEACYHACVLLKCHHGNVPTHDLVSDPLTRCKRECISSTCMDSRADAKETAGCVTSCSTECDRWTN